MKIKSVFLAVIALTMITVGCQEQPTASSQWQQMESLHGAAWGSIASSIIFRHVTTGTCILINPEGGAIQLPATDCQ